MRSQQIGQPLWRKIARNAQKQLVERQIATWIDDSSLTVIDDKELIGLDRLFSFLDQVGEHQTGVIRVAVEFDGHDPILPDWADR